MPKARRSDNSKLAAMNGHRPVLSTTNTTAERPTLKGKEMGSRQRILLLIFGDALCFFVFVSVGSNQHGEGFNMLQSLWLFLPFVAGWFIVSPFMGAFKADIGADSSKMWKRTALAWLVAWPVAMFLRWLLVERTNPVPLGSFLSFSLVTLIFNMVLLQLWRWPFALNNSLRKRGI